MREEPRDRLEARAQTKTYLHAELALEEALDPMTNRSIIMERRYGEENAGDVVIAFHASTLRLRERAGTVECGKGCARVFVELPTELRGRRAFAPPQEERQAQLFLERTERFRDGLDRHALRPRSTGKGAMRMTEQK